MYIKSFFGTKTMKEALACKELKDRNKAGNKNRADTLGIKKSPSALTFNDEIKNPIVEHNEISEESLINSSKD